MTAAIGERAAGPIDEEKRLPDATPPPHHGDRREEILDDYPKLEADDVRACIAYAHAVIADDTLAAVSVARS